MVVGTAGGRRIWAGAVAMAERRRRGVVGVGRHFLADENGLHFIHLLFSIIDTSLVWFVFRNRNSKAGSFDDAWVCSAPS